MYMYRTDYPVIIRFYYFLCFSQDRTATGNQPFYNLILQVWYQPSYIYISLRQRRAGSSRGLLDATAMWKKEQGMVFPC